MNDGVPIATDEQPTLEGVTDQPKTPEEIRREKEAAITRWRKAQGDLLIAANEEMIAREIVSEMYFPTPKRGTQSADVGYGYKLKLKHGLNITLGDKEKVDDNGAKVPTWAQVEAAIIRIAETCAEGGFIAEALFSKSWKISESQYEKVMTSSDPNRVLIAAILTEIIDKISPAAPQLTLEAPDTTQAAS